MPIVPGGLTILRRKAITGAPRVLQVLGTESPGDRGYVYTVDAGQRVLDSGPDAFLAHRIGSGLRLVLTNTQPRHSQPR